MNGTYSGESVVLGVIEVLNRSGQVMQRLPWNGRRLRVGRAYDNDMIVDDRYVCPHHLELTLESGHLWARDLGSINGSYAGRGKERVGVIELSDGLTIQIGHSQLRFHASGSEVAATWRDTARHGLLAMLGKSWMLILTSLLALLALVADSLLEIPGRAEFLSIASEMLYPLLATLVWAGFWSLLNRILTHRANFHVHLAISFIGVAGLFFLGQLISLSAFALGWDESASWLDFGAQLALLTLVLYAHLRYAMHGAPRRQVAFAAVFALVLFGTPEIGDVIERNEFSSLPYLEPLLKPPGFRLVDGKSVDEFFSQAQALRARVDQAAVK
ncbi:MAG TPA: FHA domain-containing protein [Xanthomonadales bacterium]|nr:FHA domain-containing protein [Xanthomonadales bacterium]